MAEINKQEVYRDGVPVGMHGLGASKQPRLSRPYSPTILTIPLFLSGLPFGAYFPLPCQRIRVHQMTNSLAPQFWLGSAGFLHWKTPQGR